jgi:hypothetical protein
MLSGGLSLELGQHPRDLARVVPGCAIPARLGFLFGRRHSRSGGVGVVTTGLPLRERGCKVAAEQQCRGFQAALDKLTPRGLSLDRIGVGGGAPLADLAWSGR